jgi:AbrB family looped-hinge helix DNA binding protein
MKGLQEYQRRLTHKGTVTIPVEIRNLLGVKPRGEIVFRVTEDKRVELVPPTMTLATAFGSVRPRQRPEDFEELRHIAVDEHVDKLLDEMRGEDAIR